MRAVQISETDWFIPERGGKFWVGNANRVLYWEASTQEGGEVIFPEVAAPCLPDLLRRCGYTLVWLDGRVEEPINKDSLSVAPTGNPLVDAPIDTESLMAIAAREAVTAERERILTLAETCAQSRGMVVHGVATNDYLHIDALRAIVKGGEV